MNGLQELEGLLPFLRQIQLEEHPCVVRSQHLVAGVGELLVHVVELFRGVFLQGEVSGFLLIVSKEKQVH